MTGPRDNSLLIRTPEGIEFSLPLAGPFSRMIALVIDLAAVPASTSIQPSRDRKGVVRSVLQNREREGADCPVFPSRDRKGVVRSVLQNRDREGADCPVFRSRDRKGVVRSVLQNRDREGADCPVFRSRDRKGVVLDVSRQAPKV